MLWLAAERKPVILKTGESRFSAYEIWNWLFLFKTLFRSDLFQRQVDDAELGGREQSTAAIHELGIGRLVQLSANRLLVFQT